MGLTMRIPVRHRPYQEWTLWWAWYPVKMWVGLQLTWVFWELLERKTMLGDPRYRGPGDYRFPRLTKKKGR